MAVALVAGVGLWKINEHLPQKNRAAANNLIEMQSQQQALDAIVSDLKKYGDSHPKYRSLIQKHGVHEFARTGGERP